MRRQVIS